MKKSIIAAALAIVAVCCISCKKYESVIYENYTAFVNAKTDGTLVTDNGFIFRITDTKTSSEIKEGTRAYITCDIFKSTGENEYDIRLLEVYDTAVGTIKKSSEVKESEMGQDPAYVQAAMISGGYVNIIVKYEFLDGSSTVHNMNLVLDENSIVAGASKRIKLMHNGHGEAGPESQYFTKLSTTYAVLSFPEKDLEMTEGMQLQLEYVWYESDDSKDLENVVTNTTYTPSSFIQEEAK